jgi:ribonuclease R
MGTKAEQIVCFMIKWYMLTKEFIISFFKDKVSNPLSFKEIARSLKLSHPESRRLKKYLRELVKDGEIVRTRKGLYGPIEEMNLVTGRFEMHKEGYGFVISERPGERDIFVPARATLGAMDNDRVVVRIENRKKREGSIVRILQRAHTRIAGTFESGRYGFYVRPKKRSIPFDILVAPGKRNNAKNGDTVIAEIIDYPTDKRPPTAKIIKVLKKPKTPLDEVELIIDELNLPRRFPHDVIEEARSLYTKSPESEQKRKDLRNLKTVTIDGERAKDFDDAISIEKKNNIYKLWVHIADVGFFVRWNSLIDLEARKRGTSVYFPDRVIPMLPKELSEDLCSLKPNVDRYAFTVEIDIDNKGNRVNRKFYPSIINSNERMTYTTVKKILVDQEEKERKRYDYLLRDFELMGELCNILKSKRMKRGSLDFDLPEPEVLLDIQGNPEAIIKAERNFAHRIIEEFMICANEAVAEYLESLDVPNIYRVHEEPDPTKIDEIFKIVNTLGILKAYKGIKAKDFSNILDIIRDTPEEEIINHLILRSLKRARYSTINVGHFGLASKSYSHFTSPIRRYPDLVVHRILREVLTKKYLSEKRIKELESILPEIAFHSSVTERQADEAEMAVLEAMRVWFMRNRLGESFEGRVISVTPYGLKIRLKDVFIDGFLHVSFMTDDFYQYDENTMTLYGIKRKKRFSIGKDVTVRVERVDMEEREVIFGLV